MNWFKRVLLPILIGITAAGLVIGGILIFRQGASTPEAAAAEYMKACMLQDIDGMIKYSSQYAKITLSGGAELDDAELKKQLSKIYGLEKSVYIGHEITFSVSNLDIFSNTSEEFTDLAAKYSAKADISAVESIARLSLQVYVDGAKQQTGNCCLVLVGGRWFFAFQY